MPRIRILWWPAWSIRSQDDSYEGASRDLHLNSTVEHSAEMKEHSGSHSTYQCDLYMQLGARGRKAAARKLKLCMNCLGRHFVLDSPSQLSCRTYNGRHHTSPNIDRLVEHQVGLTSCATFRGASVLLSTAMVGIDNTAGMTLMFPALLYSVSQTSFITANDAWKRHLARSAVDVKVSGDGNKQQRSQSVF